MTFRRLGIGIGTALLLIAGGVNPTSTAAAAATSGPGLRVSAAQAAKALDCTGRVSATSRPPILLLHGTTSNPEADWSWNWDRELDARRWPHCELTFPDSGNGDIQVAAEYVVRSIRTMSARAGGRRIDVVGHSQGGMIGRWALKYWPDTRGKVDDLVGLASSNHGTDVFLAACANPLGCSAANWQQRTGSRFLTALNRGPDTFPGVSWTQISTRYDEVVVPSTSTHLRIAPGTQGVNLSVQDVCPTEVVEHFGMSASNGAWLIALDALTHRGAAEPARVPTSTCGQPFMPGVDPALFPAHAGLALAQTGSSSLTTPQLPAEPALRGYAR